ncbi:MAG: GGDEF domain-containing protein [Gemmatimonadaceae bacterium]
MQASSDSFPVLSFIGVVIQLGGALLLIALFELLRRFVLRRAYFRAWGTAWSAMAIAIAALVIRYILVPRIVGASLDDRHPAVLSLYFVYQACKALAYVYFVRGALMYVTGNTAGLRATRRLWVAALIFALVSTLASRNGLTEMVIWQSVVAVPSLVFCAAVLLRLPRPRRTTGSTTTGAGFAALAALWLSYTITFALAVRNAPGELTGFATQFVALNSYSDLALDLLLGYAMILALMEDAKREVDDAQAELRLTHDRLRRAALTDSLTDSLNRRAFADGVGLEMVRATFGTVVMADIDNLKRANDRYGHSIGDQLIRHCAEVLRRELRPYDKLYRWGGDEFLLVLPSAHASDVLGRLRKVLDQADPITRSLPTHTVRLQVSLGAGDYASSAELTAAIERADKAMYAEKSRRKSDVRLALVEDTPPTSSSAVR